MQLRVTGHQFVTKYREEKTEHVVDDPDAFNHGSKQSFVEAVPYEVVALMAVSDDGTLSLVMEDPDNTYPIGSTLEITIAKAE